MFFFRLFICLLCLPLLNLEGFEKKIGVIYHDYWYGEQEFAHRLKIAASRLNWDVTLLNTCETWEDHFDQYDFLITMVPRVDIHGGCPNYLCLFDPIYHYFKHQGKLHKRYQQFDAYLHAYQDTRGLNPNSKKLLWYPTAQDFPYKVVEPNHLFFFLSLWGDRTNNHQYHLLYSLLDEQEYTRSHGNQHVAHLCPQHYRGFLPSDGHAVIEEIQEAGVTLLLHSKIHLQHGVPSGRIFEAAAASAVIISDSHPFVMEHFGDAVLYFDHTASGEVMFEQIDHHMQWIKEHPDEALEKARRAHSIFQEHFLLEDQLLRLEQLYTLNRTN